MGVLLLIVMSSQSPVSTKAIAIKVRSKLTKLKISQKVFGETVLKKEDNSPTHQSTVSDLLRRDPRPWNELTQKKKAIFLRMWEWIREDGDDFDAIPTETTSSTHYYFNNLFFNSPTIFAPCYCFPPYMANCK